MTAQKSRSASNKNSQDQLSAISRQPSGRPSSRQQYVQETVQNPKADQTDRAQHALPDG
jgi:hypothetical protein